ncbi:MAG: hypothetical protein WC714_19365 [Candidatus Obscuribacterales bacterium]|jgi:hypothetical protein
MSNSTPLSRTLVTIAVFAVGYLVIMALPGMSALQLSVTGWGWAVLIATMVLLRVGVPALFRKAFNVKWSFSNGTVFFGHVLSYVAYAAAFLVSAAVVPSLVSYSSAGLVVLLSVICGTCAGTVDWLNKRGF